MFPLAIHDATLKVGRWLMPRHGNTWYPERPHHRAMHSGKHGKGHDWYLRARKRNSTLKSLCPLCGYPLAWLTRVRDHIASHVTERA